MNWLKDLFTSKSASKDVAKDRLRMVLIQDRANCNPDLLEMIKNDIMAVLAKYVDTGDMELDMQISQEMSDTNEPMSVLSANIPIKNMRKRND
ncbi:MAG: cell division topological specificity factor MinE [Defluviitaleaceae bacterium]|jgi:cell division topological specificity factor|nr:cell division topological specificity factor MinE [Defluviitaleaceae bacterium]